MSLYKIKRICQLCKGAGSYTDSVEGDPILRDPCPECGGDGYKEDYNIDLSDILDVLSDILDKVNDIKEKVDES